MAALWGGVALWGGLGFIGAISTELDGLSPTRRADRVYDRGPVSRHRALPPTSRDHFRRFPHLVFPAPGRDRHGPGRPGALRQPLQPAPPAASLSVAEGRLP